MMGLETVELVLDLEDYFGVKLGDAEVSCCVTVGELCDVVKQHVGEGGDGLIVCEGVVCEACSYLLKMLPVVGACPECGVAYEHTDDVDLIVIKIIKDRYCVYDQEVTRDTRFIEDLNFG